MKKVISILASALLIILFGIYFVFFKNARTYYQGYVEIGPVSLLEVKAFLDEQNIFYVATDGALEVYPRGMGMGPLSFTITENRLSASKDIPGMPDSEKYKKEVREDAGLIKGAVIIEDNWSIIDVEYPWNAIY